ncbi:phenylalanine--tRNA ligase subunit beta [Candidatus Pacearchaeota archaeon]|nr:phenylalanine--tRNA ligase subunit beta [Candidatus Pacearchaeota archaeon]
MAILSISRKQFEKDIGKLDEKMENKVAMFGTPIEAITNENIDVEIFPNRPDLLSYGNFKNSFLAFLGKSGKTGLRKIKIEPYNPKKNYEVIIDKSVEKVRPYTACAIVKNLKFDDNKIKEIIDIQEKLHATLGRKRKKAAIGIYPLEEIKLPICYKAIDPDRIKFQPLEFPREITGRQILSQHPAGREYGFLLENYDMYPVFIDASNEVLSMPPIINSHKTGKITRETKEVFVECSGFDLNILKKLLNIIIFSLAEIGGKVYSMNLKYGNKNIATPDLTPESMKISLDNVNKLLGLNLKENDIKKCLEKMGYEYKNKSVLIPAYRTDILHEVDLIEDIAIAYGYENFMPKIPQISTIGEQDKKEVIKKKIAEILTGLGLLETSSYHLTTIDDQIKKTELKETNAVEVMDSKTEYNILRNDLAHYMLKILSENVDVEYPQEIFQLGKIFHQESNIIKEKEHLSIALAPGNFTKAKQIIDYLSKMLNIKFNIVNSSKIPGYFIDGRAAEITFNNKSIGHIGEIHPKILNNFKIKMPVALLEIDIEDVLRELS